MIWAPVAMADLVQECEYHPSFLTDHQYLLVKCCLREHLVMGPGVWKFNTSLLTDPSYVTLVDSFWSFWQTYQDHPDFHSVLGWWDQGKFYLRELTQTFSTSKAADQRSRKSYLTHQLHTLQSLFESGDRTAFTKLCEVQQELCSIALHEAKGAQVRTRCQWAEEGETSSSFFLNLETKCRAQKTMLSMQDPATGIVHHDSFEILGVWRSYYADLFTPQECNCKARDAMLAQLSRRLSSAEREACEGVLTVEEHFHALQGTPGSDGFPMEFFVAFWQTLGADLVRVLNIAYETDQLSTSQRRGLIIVLYKKNDPLDTKNWRPISLLNVDYKIATRTISGRLLVILSSIIGPDQTCGVPGRTISSNLFLIRDLLECVE